MKPPYVKQFWINAEMKPLYVQQFRIMLKWIVAMFNSIGSMLK